MPLDKLFSSLVFICEIYSKWTLGGAGVTLLTHFTKVKLGFLRFLVYFIVLPILLGVLTKVIENTK